MKTQTTIFNNSVRADPLQYSENAQLRLKQNESKEYVTKNGCVVTVVKKSYTIQGVSLYPVVAYQINDAGKIIEPMQSKGVKNYLKNN